MRTIFTGLLIVFVLACLIAGALANWHTPEPHIPAIDRCPLHESGNPWCPRN